MATFCLKSLLVFVLLNLSIHAQAQYSTPLHQPIKTRLPEEFSAHQPTILPVLTSDGKRLYFDRKNYAGDTGGVNDFDDIWFSDLLPSGLWSKAQNLGAPLNTLGSDVLCSLSPDDRTALVYGIYDKELPVKNEGFSLSRFKNGAWQFPEPITIRNFYNHTKKYYARLAPDNRTLLLALQRSESLGGLDLYVSFREDTSLVWSEPLHLGKTLNTNMYEGSPHLAADGKTLYFSSEGLGGSGVADLFVSRRLDDSWQRWSTPVNLGAAINSEEEDSSIDVVLDGKGAYFLSSDSAGGRKGLYQAVIPDSLRHKGAVLLHGQAVLDKELEKTLGKTLSQMPQDARVVVTAYGTVRDSAGMIKPALTALAETVLSHSQHTAHDYALALPSGNVYVLQASVQGSTAIPVWTAIADTRTKEIFQRREQNIVFSAKAPSNLVFPSVHFAQEQASIPPEYAPALTLIAFTYKTLSANVNAKSVRVEIVGHTCDLGTSEKNDALAQERAEAVAAFLESNGIPQGTITVRSEGERKPLVRSALEDMRALNRRVDVRLTMQGQALKRAQR
jgi:outer membrane protein OmpA-like peptidoglycan-associated protein